MAKKIDELIHDLKIGLETQYGVDSGLVGLSVEPELFDRIMFDLYSKTDIYGKTTTLRFRPSDFNDVQVLGVAIDSRKKAGK